MKHPQGWDICDALAEGLDLAAFIKSCPLLETSTEESKRPFRPLGYDAESYWFLRSRQRLPYRIEKGHFSASKLGELAPLEWWSVNGLTTDQGGIRQAQAQDMIITDSEAVGMFDAERLRGAGVWMDHALDGEGRIIINDGRRIMQRDGAVCAYADFVTQNHYIASDVSFGEMNGEESTDDEGRALEALFVAQRFTAPSFALYAMGWSLISCFGGLLSWRPHIWITGRKGTGKSWAIENLIGPLCGDFASKWGSRASEPGIRRTLRTDARPVIIDEMEPKNKAARDKIDALTDLARNASCDSSARSVLASGEGTVKFMVRSCFCFASVVAPEMNAANESRIMRLELQALDGTGERDKQDASRAAASLLQDPARYRRRIFRALPRILADIEYLRSVLPGTLGDQREVDMWAPILASVWAAQSEQSVQGEAGKTWLIDSLNVAMKGREEATSDEQRVVECILEAQIRTDEMRTRTVAELLVTSEAIEGTGQAEARATLERYGLKVAGIRNGDGRTHYYLAVAQKSKEIARMLAGTAYEHGYDQQLQRHVLCKDGEAHVVRLAGKNTRCRCLDWDQFRVTYLGETQGRLEGTA